MQTITLNTSINSSPVIKDKANDLTSYLNQKFESKIDTKVLYNNDEKNAYSILNEHKNPLVNALHIAYAQHVPVEISPDDIWLTILTGLSNHINTNKTVAEAFAKKHSLSLTEKKELRVYTTFIYPGIDCNWLSVFPEFEKLINSNLIDNNLVNLTSSKFSTSSIISSSAFQIMLMDTCKQFFEYTVYYRCGIPEIRLLGTTDDWKKIYNSLDKLREYGLDIWATRLKEIISQFINASLGNVDQDFWKNIFKFNNKCGSGHDYITGWIVDLFPYFVGWDNKLHETTLVNPKAYKDNPSIDSFGIGMASVDFKWVIIDQQYNMQFIGGFLGTGYSSAQNVVKPIIGCAIVEKKK